jgi:hypothetical protein
MWWDHEQSGSREDHRVDAWLGGSRLAVRLQQREPIDRYACAAPRKHGSLAAAPSTATTHGARVSYLRLLDAQRESGSPATGPAALLASRA